MMKQGKREQEEGAQDSFHTLGLNASNQSISSLIIIPIEERIKNMKEGKGKEVSLNDDPCHTKVAELFEANKIQEKKEK